MQVRLLLTTLESAMMRGTARTIGTAKVVQINNHRGCHGAYNSCLEPVAGSC